MTLPQFAMCRCGGKIQFLEHEGEWIHTSNNKYICPDGKDSASPHGKHVEPPEAPLHRKKMRREGQGR